MGWSGDDTFNITGKSGAYTDTINGGDGTNVLSIVYSGITKLSDFAKISVPTSSGSTITFTDSNGGSINFTNILSWTGEMKWDGYVTINSLTYRFVSDYRSEAYPWEGAYGSVYAFIYESGSNVEVVVPTDGLFNPNYRMSGYRGFEFDGNEVFTVTGSSGSEIIKTGYKADTINAGDGDDQIAGGDGADTIDAGAGDDVVYLTKSALTEDSSIDGGTGSNTLSFFNVGTWDNESYGATTFDLSSELGNATNFQNISGSSSNDTLTGDSNANVIIGAAGDDTLSGGDGNDSLYGDMHTGGSSTNQKYGVKSYSLTEGADSLYGGAGNDILVGNAGNDTLDGGTGTDTLTGGSGIDTFVLRSGDGGATQAAGDTITDFTDGTDSLGLDNSLLFSDLTIEQIGSDTVIKEGSNYLATLSGITASNITILDFQSTSTSNQTFNGTSGNDTLIGGAGDDTFNGGAGSDTFLGWSGDDTFNITGKSGAYTDTINGGDGTNVLSIVYSGITKLSDFTTVSVPTSSGSTISFVDGNSGTINFTNILSWTGEMKWDGYVTINSLTYRFVSDYRSEAYPWEGAYGSVYAFIYESGSNVEVVVPTDGLFNPNYRMSSYRGFEFDGNEVFTVTGSSGSEIIKTGYKADTINAGAGDDQIAGGDGADTINAGAGDDVVYLTKSALTEDASIDGGTGSNTLSFFNVGTWDNESYGAVNFNLATELGNASNFQNIAGSSSGDTLTGDSNANVIIGAAGGDIIYGKAGNDSLYGDMHTGGSSTNQKYGVKSYSLTEGADSLYGGAGNDILVGNAGNDTLDGGTGTDTLTGGNGIDTFVIRTGDGSSTLADANVITDFTDGTDVIGLDNGLTFGDLNISQGTGDYANHTIIKYSTEYLFIVQNTTSSNFTDSDFTPVDINELLANNIYSGTLDDGTLDIDFSGIRELPPRDINVESEDMDSNQLPVIEENNKIELNLEEDLSEILLQVKDPEPVSETTDNDIGYVVDSVYEEDELLFAGLEI